MADDQWPHDVDDGHEHVFDLVPEDDLGVNRAVMCSLCGMLSTEDDDHAGA